MEDFEISVKKSKRKTMSIYVERDGIITILAPENMTNENIEKIVEQKKVLDIQATC